MGIVISSGIRTAPLSVTSTIIGFVSFAFTVGTFLKIVWVNLETMSEAPHEVHSYLTNLRTELIEERTSLKEMRKQAKKYHREIRRQGGDSFIGIELDDVTLKTMNDMIRHCIRQFKEIEKPFLAPGAEGIDGWKKHARSRRRDSSVSPYYQHSAYASPPEKGVARAGSRGERSRGRKGREDDEEDDDDRYWAQRTDYAKFNLKRRMLWIWKKSDAQNLFETLTRVQVRRTARQVGGISYVLHQYGSRTCNVEEMIKRVDERMNNIVGIRRVD